MILIGLTGPAGAGKDTLADHLCARHHFVRYAFAKPLKDMLAAIGVDANNRDTKEIPHPVFGKSPRVMAQTLGTEWMRETICQDGWLRLAGQFVDTTRHLNAYDAAPYVGVVITDCRFPNEVEFIRKRGGVVWNIHRNVARVAAHSSETSLNGSHFDKVIYNLGTIAELHGVVDDLLRGK